MRTEVSYNDMPRWAKDAIGFALRNARKRPKCYFEASESHHFGQPWHDACSIYYFACDAHGTVQNLGRTPYYDALAFNSSAREQSLYMGGDVKLQPNCYILTVETYPEHATIYCHPNNLPKALSPHPVDLTRIEQTILQMMCELTSAGRKDQCSRYYLPYKLFTRVAEDLQSKGLVAISKNGAIKTTLEGRQRYSVGLDNPIDLYSEWQPCWNWTTRKWSGLALDIIQEYRGRDISRGRDSP